MAKHNYSQYSNKKKPNEKPAEAVKPVVKPVETVEEAPKVVIDPEIKLVKEEVETVALPEMVEGMVVGCAKLNVREKPSITASVVYVLDNMAELAVDVAGSNNEWVKICTATGIEGYCMREFIDVRL